MKREKFDRRRGRHKKRASHETKDWNREHLMEKRPPWMDVETYVKLMELRNS